MSEPKQFTLADIAAAFAEVSPGYKHFHAKLFSYIPPEPEKFATFLLAMKLRKEAFPNSHPATVIVGRLGGLVPLQSKQVMATSPTRRLQILSQISDLKLPDCDYLAMISPFVKKSLETKYQLAFESIEFLRTFLSFAFGKLPFYTPVAEFDFDENGAIGISGGVIRMPLNGDLFGIHDVNLANEILARLALQQPEYRQRLQKACAFFDMALDQKDEAFRFSAYWIALEIIVPGKSDAIRSMIAKAYGKTTKGFADEELCFKDIEQLRHGLMHKGIFGTLQSFQERLMQLYFWDIVSYQIGLKNRRLAMAFVESGMIQAERSRRAGQ